MTRGSRSVCVCRCARLARDESPGLCLDLVEGEVDRREVRPREMRVEGPGRVEEGRKVVGRHCAVVVVVAVSGECARGQDTANYQICAC